MTHPLDPMPEMTDRAYDARAVLGPSISRTWQILGNLGSFEDRVRFMDELLLRQSLRAPEGGGISHAANTMVLDGGRADLNALAGSVGLSTRQFARKFIPRCGRRSPASKSFLKIIVDGLAQKTPLLHRSRHIRARGRSWPQRWTEYQVTSLEEILHQHHVAAVTIYLHVVQPLAVRGEANSVVIDRFLSLESEVLDFPSTEAVEASTTATER